MYFNLFPHTASSRKVNIFNILPTPKKPTPSKPAEKPVCGKKHKKRLSVPRGRILGGNAALPGTHPWMAAIYFGQSDFCAGTLISSCWILSAAHCFFRKYVMDTHTVICNGFYYSLLQGQVIWVRWSLKTFRFNIRRWM